MKKKKDLIQVEPEVDYDETSDRKEEEEIEDRKDEEEQKEEENTTNEVTCLGKI